MNRGCRKTRSAAEDAERQPEDEHDGGEADQDPSAYTIRLRDEKTLRTPGPRHALANLLIVGVPWSTPEKSHARGGDRRSCPNADRQARRVSQRLAARRARRVRASWPWRAPQGTTAE